MFYPDLSPAIAKAIQSLRNKKVAVLGHLRPDGDCVGSQIALCRILLSMGIKAICLNPDPVPRRLRFLLEDTPFLQPDNFSPDGHTAITVDCADKERTGSLRKLFPQITLNIDHHISNSGYASTNFIDSSSAATAEIIGGIALDNGWQIDPITAKALYVGIATDTGQFRFPSTTRRVFTISGALIDRGADPAKISRRLYEQESIGKMQLLRKFLASLKLECGGRVCIGFLDDKSYAETGTTTDDAEGLVDYPRSIEQVDIAGIIEIRQNEIKGSLRAKEARFRVDEIAAQFNGGGHAAAAGFNTAIPFDRFYPLLLDTIQKRLDESDRANG